MLTKRILTFCIYYNKNTIILNLLTKVFVFKFDFEDIPINKLTC